MKISKQFRSVGGIVDFKINKEDTHFNLINGKAILKILGDDVFRLQFTFRESFDKDVSYAIETPPIASEGLKVASDTKNPDVVEFGTKTIKISISKANFYFSITNLDSNKEIINNSNAIYFNPKTGAIRCYNSMEEFDHFYGFGEKTGNLDKKGSKMKMHTRDWAYYRDQDPLYQSHPFFIRINRGQIYAIFLDNISKTTFDMGKTDKKHYYFEVSNGDLNYYFIKGNDIADILCMYTELTGRMAMVPKWTLGYHQCRYSYRNEAEIRDITRKFRENKVPCDGIWFDIHYMDGYRCFTFDSKAFPDVPSLISDLKKDGFKSTVIVDPGIKVDKNYPIYNELVENKYFTQKADGSPSYGVVWPGVTHFPDYTREEVREWWADKHKYYFDMGFEGIWNDMNEPALSINYLRSAFLNTRDMYMDDFGRRSVIKDCRNVFGLTEAMGTYLGFKKSIPNKRPFILTRSGYSGIQKYAAIWTGDNWSNWYNVTLACRMCVNLNLSAQSFVGADIGGHMSISKMLFKKRNFEMFIRWLQSGVFHPFCRVHSTIGTPMQDPFSYGEDGLRIIKKFIEIRYKFMPYIYTLFNNYHSKGEPIIRPLFYNDLDDEIAHNKKYQNQFYLGPNMMIAPVDKPKITSIEVYLPKGEWIEYFSNKEYLGQKIYEIPLSIEEIPVFIRKGAIVPQEDIVEFIGQKANDTLIVEIFGDSQSMESEFRVYEDDGDSMQYSNAQDYCFIDLIYSKNG